MENDKERPGISSPPYFEDIILVRELCEVYLLIDHLSGRWDKRLVPENGIPDGARPGTAVPGGAATNGASDSSEAGGWIKRICDIGWSENTKSASERAADAATLILAKDRFNAAAKPATGMTIAFTLMVTALTPPATWWQRLFSPRLAAPPDRRLTSRTAMARTAFPKLVRVAENFKRKIFFIVWSLLCLLILTCILSWNISGGYSILNRLDAIEVRQHSIRQKIDAVQVVRPSAAVTESLSVPGTVQLTPDMPIGLCRVLEEREKQVQMDRSVLQLPRTLEVMNLCLSLQDIHLQRHIALVNLSNWMSWWKRVRSITGKKSGSGKDGENNDALNEEWARIFVPVVINSILPFLYGILGAGASVMRYLRMKTRESLLLPRDFSLVLNQLVLGATIGACIGLFAAQSGDGATGAGTSGIITGTGLTGSALSFLAGFGVEGVFAALESLVRRVFNLPDPNPKG